MNKKGQMVKCYEIIDSESRKVIDQYADFSDAKAIALKNNNEVWFEATRISLDYGE